jgi:hypothetical protein
VLLADASDPAWRLGFAPGVAALLKAGTPRSHGLDCERTPRLVSDAELELALAQPLLIVIDGLNEPEEADGINWRSLLQEATQLIERERPWRLLVTVRSHAWKHRISSSSLSAACQELCIPLWSDKECRALAERLGFAWAQLDPEVAKQLRKPRMLIAAARIPPEKLQGWELSYALVLLLDLQQRGDAEHARLSFDDYCGLLQDLGKNTLAESPLTRDVLKVHCTALDDAEVTRELELLCDQGLIRRDHAKLRIDEQAASVAIGLRLLQILRDTGKSDLDDLREEIARTLADGQDDTTGKALGHAIAAGLHPRIDGAGKVRADGDPVLSALFLEWQRRYNRGASPRRQLRWLLPELGSLAQSAALNDPEDWLADALQAEPADPIRTAFLRRLDQWFTGMDLAAESFTGPSNQARVEKRRLRFQQGQRLVGGLREAGSKEARLRSLGLEVAKRCALDPRAIDLNALIVAVAVQPADGWDPLIKWVCKRPEDWWPLLEPIWASVAERVDIGELRDSMAKLLRAMWPTPVCLRRIELPEEGGGSEHREGSAYRRLVDVNQSPDADALNRLHAHVDSAGLHIRQPELAALALWSPHRLQLHIASLIDHATNPDKPIGFFGTELARLAPLLTPVQARRLRVRASEGSDIGDSQCSLLSLAGVWQLPQARRTAAMLRHLRLMDLSDDELLAASLTAEAAAQLVKRLVRDPQSAKAGRIALWLCLAWSEGDSEALKSALANALPSLSKFTLPPATEYWLLRLSHWLRLDALAVHMIDLDWSYVADTDPYIQTQRARSAVLSASATLGPQALRTRCHPDHWRFAAEPAQSELAAERAERMSEFLLSDTSEIHQSLANSPDPTVLRETVRRYPQLPAIIMELPDSYRTARAIELAFALVPQETARWLDLMREAVIRQSGFSSTTNGINNRYLIAFKTPDSPEAREIWNALLDDIENDAELLQLVVAAKQGRGSDWLQSCANLDPSSIPHQQLRTATLAAMIGVTAERAAVTAATQSHGGWMAKGFEHALALYASDELALAWYRRFRSAPTWPEAWGSWHMQCEWVDLRRRLWEDKELPAHALPDTARFEADFHRDLKNAIDRQNKQLEKTRFGFAI